jgi:hypothetical protein
MAENNNTDESWDEINTNTNTAEAPIKIDQNAKVEDTSIATTGGVRDVTQFMNADAQAVKEALAKQPKVETYIPLSPGEKIGVAFETVTINGYRLEIKKGMMVSVPRQVFEMIREMLNIEASAGREYLVSNDEKRQEALS